MKKVIIFCLLLTVSVTSFSQQTPATKIPLTKTDYLQKSKKQKTAAWILLGGGTAMTAGSIVWASQNIFSTSSGPTVLFVVGCVSMVGSIPLFIASSKNKKRAMSVSFKNESAPQLINRTIVTRPLPSLNLKINL